MSQSPDYKRGLLSDPLWRWFQSFSRSAAPGANGRVRIEARSIYILPTRFGLLYGAMLLAMLLGANNYGSNPGFLLTFLLAGLGMAALFQTWKNLLNLEIRVTPGEPVFKGLRAGFPTTIHNGHKEPRPGIVLRADGEITTKPVDVPAMGTNRTTFHRNARRRGWLPAGRTIVETRFPLGLFRAWAYVKSDVATLVYPAPAEISEGITRGGDNRVEAPPVQTGDDDFAGHRLYQEGDAAMHVDWKVLARGMGWQVKVFESPRGEEFLVSWDAAESTEQETRLAGMVRAVLEMDSDGKSWGLELPGTRLPVNTGSAHRNLALKALALFNLEQRNETA